MNLISISLNRKVTEDAKKLREICKAGQAPDHIFGDAENANAKKCAHFFRSLSIDEAEKLRRSFNILAHIGRFHGDLQNDTCDPTKGFAPLNREMNDVNSRIFRHWARVGGAKLCEDISLLGTQPTLPQKHSCSYDIDISPNVWSSQSLEYLELMHLFPMAFTDAADANRVDNYCCKILENQYIFIHHLGIFGCLFNCLFCLFVSSLVY